MTGTRSQRTTLHLALWTLGVAWWDGIGLALETGIALHVAWWSPWNAPLWLLLLTVGLFLAGRSQRPIRTLALLLAGYVVGASLAWIWVRADEARFAQEVIHDPQATRARWWPYSAVAWLSRGEDGGIVATD